jgi:hypothetical protein
MTDTETRFNLHDLQCPSCGAPHMGVVAGKRLSCSYCGADFVIAETVCPECANFNDPGTDFCVRCGTAISRLCTACGTRNWANAEICEHCGRSLDLIEEISARLSQTTQRRLQQQMDEAPAVKQLEEDSSRARSAALWEIEQRRQELLFSEHQRAQAHEQRVVMLIVVGLLIFIALVVVALAVQGGLR